ncbi:MAG: L,D-transpeptidase [Acidimicrobiales bacterium]
MRRPGGLRPRVVTVAGSVAAVVAVLVGLLLVRGPVEPRADAAVVTGQVVDAPTTTTTAPPPTTTEPPPTTTTAAGLPDPRPGPPIYPTVTALAKVPAVAVYDRPGGGLVRTIPSPRPPINGIASFRVLDQSTPGWLRVQLPTRPNGSTGWIRSTDVSLGRTEYSIDIDLAARWMTVYSAARVVAERRIADGAPATPTPVGEFYVSEVVPGGGGAYGPWAFGVAAHSDVLTEFAGGDGQIALHGTNLPGLLGTAASHGCVRMPNDLSQFLHDAGVPQGTPVRIHRG